MHSIIPYESHVSRFQHPQVKGSNGVGKCKELGELEIQ